jgi:hypothetical protein
MARPSMRASFELRPDLNAPLLDHRLVPLGRSFDGQLGCPAQALQGAQGLRLVVRDAQRLPADSGHAGTRSHLVPKAACLLAMREQRRDQAQLGACELDWPCGPRLGPPHLHAVLPQLRQPLADSHWEDRKRFSNVLLFPPVLLEFKRPFSARLFSGFEGSLFSVHVRILAHGKN